MRLKPLVAAALLGAFALLAWTAAQANFASSDGFTGRNGFTCTSCHVVPHPLDDDAKAVLEGLPAAWTPGETYLLTIRVEGGPMALPAPAPQGGFEIESDTGTFSEPPGLEGLLRQTKPWQMTYEPEGTLQREWTVRWNAPNLADRPRDATFWLAVLSANGNHVVLTNTSDSGEKYDSVASLSTIVPPTPAALAAWRDLPLLPPRIESASFEKATWTVDGAHTDGNATGVAWRLDHGAWVDRPTGQSWRLVLPGLSPGDHALEIRSEGAERQSPAEALALEGGRVVADPADRDSPALPALPILIAAFAYRRFRP